MTLYGFWPIQVWISPPLLLRFCLFRVRHTYRSALLCLSCEGMESYYARRRHCCVTHHASFDCGTQGCDVKSDSGAAFWRLRCSDIAHSPSENGLFSPFLACWAGEEEPSLNVVFTNCNRQILHSMQPKVELPGKQCISYGDLCCNNGPNCLSLHNTQDWSLTI